MTSLRRITAAATIAATGVLVAVPNATRVSSAPDLAGLVLSVLGTVIGTVLVGTAVYLLRSDISTTHVVRVAGWNGLGVVVLGLVLGLAALTSAVALPAGVAAVVLGVSAVAHVLIGVNDVRRIRATELAREREKLAVLNRLARHNLRNDAQVLAGAAGIMREDVDDETRAEIGERVAAVGDDLASMSQRLKEMQAVVEDEERPEPRALGDLVDRVVEDCRERYPEATIETDVPDVRVRATSHLATALTHLVENAVVHTDSERIRVTATVRGGTVELAVADEGPGIPETERAVLTGERERTQLEHASGLGLWVVKSAVEQLGGHVGFGDGEGAEVQLHIPAA